ncbi:hypothetical protein ADL35_18600, partial [Streptomyces sp. NRRL WC-3753]
MQYTAADYRRKAEDAITDHRNGRNHNGLTEAHIYAQLALGLAIGSVTGSGPSAVAAMGRLRASLRAYAVMEGEDPVAVL